MSIEISAKHFIEKKGVTPVVAKLISMMANDIAADLAAKPSNGPQNVTAIAAEATDKFLSHISNILAEKRVAVQVENNTAQPVENNIAQPVENNIAPQETTQKVAKGPIFLMYEHPTASAPDPKNMAAINTAAEQQAEKPSERSTLTPSMGG